MFGIFQNIGTFELIVIVSLIVFFFGGKKLSEFAQNLRDSSKETSSAKEAKHSEKTKDSS